MNITEEKKLEIRERLQKMVSEFDSQKTET